MSFDSFSQSEEKDMDKESTAHADEFRGALDTLLGEGFPSLEAALKALELFKLKGYSPLYKNRDIMAKQTEKKTSVFECGQKGCSFRLLLHHPFGEKKDFWFGLGQKGVKEHSGHVLRKPQRASKKLLELVEDFKEVAAQDGSQGLELQKRTLIAVSDAMGGEDALKEATYNHLRRKLEKEKLSLRGKDAPETFDVMIRDGESLVTIQPQSCHPDLLAVLGLLLRVQKKLPETYINVAFDKHLQYVFFALPGQRRKGSLYGDIRLFDDKHGVSQNGYHLASCTVQGNQTLEIAACALFDSSNGANWKIFVEDCCKAFETTTNAPKRPWKLSIADGDGCIESAIKAVDPSVEFWSCWKHFRTSITTKHLSKAGEWSSLHQIMEKILTSDSVRLMETWVNEARELVQGISQHDLKEKEQTMLDQVLTRRLQTLKVFSNGWNSQSGAENTNSIWQNLGVGASHSLAVVVDKLLAYLEREESRSKEKANSKTNLSPLVSPLADHLSQKAFSLILTQFNEVHNYEAKMQGDGKVWHVSRKGLDGEQDLLSRTVRQLESGWSCSCNMPVYLGIHCRHILCVMVQLQLKVPWESAHSRWWRDSKQPQIQLRNISPFQAKQGIGTDVDSRPAEEDFPEGVDLGPEAVPFEQYIAENGGDFGEDSVVESVDIVVMQGGAKPLDKISPKERRNELTNHFYQLVQRIGYGKGSLEALDELEKCLIVWEETHVKETGGFGLAASVKSTGRPPEHALKPGNNQSRSNGVKSKKPYKCGICGKVGHTAGSKCPEKCWDCPKDTKNHRKGNCPTLKRGREEQEDGKEDGNVTKAGKKVQVGEVSTTVSTSQSSKGCKYLSFPHLQMYEYLTLFLCQGYRMSQKMKMC